MSTNRYTDMLSAHFVPRARALFGNDYVFAQDNAPCHKSKAAMDFFREKQVELLPWPAGSPDLNPIENMWAILKENVAKRFPKTKEQLEAIAKDEWEKIPQETVRRTVMSIPTRISQVLEREGGKCDY
jgi:transposase